MCIHSFYFMLNVVTVCMLKEVPKPAQNMAPTPLDSIDISAVKFSKFENLTALMSILSNVLYQYGTQYSLVPLLL